MIHHLANNDELDDFEVISFVNTDGTIETGTLSPDTAMLFGVGTTGATAQMCLGSICVTVPSPQVFDESAYHSTEPTWTYETDTVKFSYYKYEVVTVDNETFGVEAGHEGTFHVFTAYAQDAGAAPLNEEAFDVYSTLFDDTIAAVTTHGGWEHLAAALDLE